MQSDLAKSLQYMIDQEQAAAGKGRGAGMEAARAAFYTGDIGRTIVAYHEQNGGLLRMADLAEFRSGIEPSVAVPFGEFSVHTCGPWCQGPVLGQMLRLVEATGCHKQPHNSFAYVHALTAIMKLAFADRHAYYADPKFVDVPLDRLLSRAYAAERAALVRDDSLAGHAAAGARQVGNGSRFRSCRNVPAAAARYVLRVRGGSPRQRVLGDAERRLQQYTGDPGHGSVRLLARLAIVGRSLVAGFRRTRQAAAADAEPGAGSGPRWPRHSLWHARW